MRIALVHDDLVQWGGAERVLAAMAEIFPDAPIYTSIYDDNNMFLKQHFASKKIITSFIQKIPGWKSLYKILLPLYPIAFEQFDFSDFDLVISHTTRFAKSIITKPQTYHICYCHTPPRFLWNFSGEQSPAWLNPYFSFLKNYDLVVSKRIDKWIAGSQNAKQRIREIYRADAEVIYPFVDLKKFSHIEPFDGGYLLVVSRLNYYKRVDLTVKVASKLKLPLKIIGSGPQERALKKLAGATVEFLGSVDEELLLMTLAGCKALVIAGEEDFGLTALEAQALGKPVIAYKKGGVLETVLDKETGYLFSQQTIEDLTGALVDLDKRGYNQMKCRWQAGRFSKDNFTEHFHNLVSAI